MNGATTGAGGVNKSGGDVAQGNLGAQGNLSGQDLNSVGVGGAGILEGLGGSAGAVGAATQAVGQSQGQANAAFTGGGGDDNINANTTISI